MNIAIRTGAGRREQITGLPFVVYTIFVARIVARELGLGKDSIIGALLYDLIKEADLTIEEIVPIFGQEIAEILESLSRISEINTSKTNLQTESFRKLILTMAGDVQVLLIKIAERLVVMRYLENADQEAQVMIAGESGYLYASLAHRLGLYNIKSELEDLSMKYLEPEQYDEVLRKIKITTGARNRFIRDFIKPLKEQLDKENLDFEIKGRLKSIHSIWSKMKRQNIDFEEVYDLFAIRIILKAEKQKERALCWHVYSIVTDLYTPNPQRLRDWISIPKSNGYESLHITVASPRGRWVEVQVRTERMNEIAEKGLAAHYLYKEAGKDKILDEWLGKMREILEGPETETPEFVDQVKLNLYSDEIFVFTPKGDLKRLPKGATLLDFAFEIHSEVGLKCAGGKVNQKNATLKQVLDNGDLVEITTSKNQKPKQDWLHFVVTSKARSGIKQSLNQEKLKAAEIGKEMLKRRMRNWKIAFNDDNVKKLLKEYKLKYAQDLYYLISEEKIVLSGIKELLIHGSEKNPVVLTPGEPMVQAGKTRTHKDLLLIQDEVDNIDYKLAKCCNPIIGDKIFGFVTITEGVKVHLMDCPNAKQLLTRYPYRVIRLKWTHSSDAAMLDTVIKISGLDEAGMVNRISELVTQGQRVSIQSVNYSAGEGTFDSELRLKVLDKDHLDKLIRRLMKIKGVLKVSRVSSASL